jgi:soluble lytic murein transglycosylase-like protein
MSAPLLAVLRWAVMIRRAAAAHGLPAAIVASMVEQESAGNPEAWNPEPPYPYLWDVKRNRKFVLLPGEALAKSPPERFPTLQGDRDQEWWAQQASWGLLQIMGATARELGCRAEYLTHLVADPTAGLEYGCLYLARLLKRCGTIDGAISAYNAGSPQPPGSKVWHAYVVPVMSRVDAYAAALAT